MTAEESSLIFQGAINFFADDLAREERALHTGPRSVTRLSGLQSFTRRAGGIFSPPRFGYVTLAKSDRL
jgi:hypothetical protein